MNKHIDKQIHVLYACSYEYLLKKRLKSEVSWNKMDKKSLVIAPTNSEIDSIKVG